MIFYVAVAMTVVAAVMAHKAWGTAAAVGFAVINALVIWVFPIGNVIGLALAGAVLYMVSREPEGAGDPGDAGLSRTSLRM